MIVPSHRKPKYCGNFGMLYVQRATLKKAHATTRPEKRLITSVIDYESTRFVTSPFNPSAYIYLGFTNNTVEFRE